MSANRKRITAVAGALAFFTAVFLNAFIDLGHKIVIQNTIFKIYDGQQQVVLTAIVNGLILLPFILLFSPAGFASDRFPKIRVMRASAWAAVLLTTAITFGYAVGWFWVSFAMTFLMAVQSTFYSPAKYGYIKALFGKERLAEANGAVQAISMVAILSGTLLFSILFEWWFPVGATDESTVLRALPVLGFVLVASSVVELVMVYRLPDLERERDEMRFDTRRYLSGHLLADSLKPVWRSVPIRLSIIGLATFWSIGQVMLAAFPAFVEMKTGETNTIVIQAIIATSGIGIALGSWLASRCSRNYIETGLMPLGALGIAVGLFVLPGLQSLPLMAVCLLLIGTMGGLFIVPLNAMMQYCAENRALGKTLAASNFIQNIAMLSFLAITVVFALTGVGIQTLLIAIAVLACIGGFYTVCKLPQSLVRLLASLSTVSHCGITVRGMNNIPQTGGLLLLGNQVGWSDWAILQIACPRPVHFVMPQYAYRSWYPSRFFKWLGCIVVEPSDGGGEALRRVAEWLNDGRVVCLFSEDIIDRTGHLTASHSSYEHAAQVADETVRIVPFYLRGLWDSRFSSNPTPLKKAPVSGWRRRSAVAFGEVIDKDTDAETIKHRVLDLSTRV